MMMLGFHFLLLDRFLYWT